MVAISGFADMAFGNYPGTGDLNANDDLCVYRNNPSSAVYTITATASEGSFQVEDGAKNIAYSVFFNDETGTTGEIALNHGDPSANQTGANTQSVDCSTGGDKANVHVQFSEANLQAAEPGNYSGTLILTATPV